MPNRQPRCPICCNAGWHDRADGRECTHCELHVAHGAALADVREEIRLALPRAGRDGIDAGGWRLCRVAMRNAAWALGYRWSDGAWRAARPLPHGIVLGVIGRPADLPMIEALSATPGFRRAVAVLDGHGSPPPFSAPGLRIAMRPLGGDFAEQRNHVQALAEHEAGGACWVLQLDTDETPTAALLEAVGWMVDAAEADGLRSIGLPRRNLVDGAVSALFPDIQYRLNRSDIRFDNPVHERPSVAFRHTTLGLSALIEHRLDAGRVRDRSRRYEAIKPGGGRPADEQALSQPFEPGWQGFG